MALKSWYLDGSARCLAVAVRQQHQGRKFYYITRDGQNQSSNIQTNIYRLDVQGEQLLIHPYNNNNNNNNNRSSGGDDDLDDEDANDLADSLKSMKLTKEKVSKFLILDQNQIVVYGQIEGGNRGIYLMDGRCGQKRNMYIYKEQCQGKIIQRMKVMSGGRLEEDKGDEDRLDFLKEFIDGKKTADLKKFSSLLYDHHMEAPTIMDLMTRLLSDDDLQTSHFKQRLRSVVHHLQLPNDFTQYLSTMNLHHVLKLLKFLHDELVSNEEEDDENDDHLHDHLHPHHHSTIETIIDWLNMLLDCHYPRLVLHLAGSREVKSSKSNNSADDISGGEGASLLNDILTYIDVTVSEAKEGLCQKIINQAKYLKVKQKKSSRKRYYIEAFQFS
ncbi:hypothetical protein HELRODRAFT_179919 [Helobdella robusta]|uniref:Uncharacterized protein n=1 Tax=Helobdella robusta TaxID=6412 RepID=T1FF91_HELRO|nr:hypothetical protein HELRODRAFT_179919 [Helobdella robusta]ESN95056.1 hypothetical protein HELRODRAFT_179919 [Helobdella robusta]